MNANILKPNVVRALRRLIHGYTPASALSESMTRQFLQDGWIEMDDHLMYTYPDRGTIWRLTETGHAVARGVGVSPWG